MGMGANARREVVLQLLLTLCIWGNVRVSEGIWLTLPESGTKCVSEDIHTNVVVLADYVVVSEDNSHLPTISIKVQSFHLFLFELNFENACISNGFLKSQRIVFWFL